MGLYTNIYTNIDRIPPIVSSRCHEEECLGLAVIKRYVQPVANEPCHEKTCSDFVFVIYIDDRIHLLIKSEVSSLLPSSVAV